MKMRHAKVSLKSVNFCMAHLKYIVASDMTRI